MYVQGIAVRGRQGAAGTRQRKKEKEGTKSDDSFPQRGYGINPPEVAEERQAVNEETEREVKRKPTGFRKANGKRKDAGEKVDEADG